MQTDGARREEILATAASLFATSGIGASVQVIADACGILPGSLYHHFESKEMIVVELVQRYRDDLDRVAAEALDGTPQPGAPALGRAAGDTVEQQVVRLGEAIAACAVRHRAALLLTLYEAPASAGPELVELVRQTPVAIERAMAELLAAARSSGELRQGVAVPLLAERICQSMLHIGVGAFHRQAAGELPARKCHVLLHGIAVRTPPSSRLERSEAMTAARGAVASWDHGEGAADRAAELRTVARAEFGRRGYEATTIRHIARASGISTGTIYRMVGSKEDLLASIMSEFTQRSATAWDAVVSADSTPLERLDALMWVNVNMVERFSDELRIELAWLRQSPPSSADIGFGFVRQIEQLQTLLTDGEVAGEIRPEDSTPLDRARSTYELLLTPESIVAAVGVGGAHALARDTVLRGALVRP